MSSSETSGAAPAYSCACSGCAGKAAALLAGTRWSGGGEAGATVLTYSFASAGPADASRGPIHADREFSSDDRAQVRAVLDGIEAVCGLRFVEVPDGGSGGAIRYGYSQAPEQLAFAAMAYYPSDAPQAGDVWLGLAQAGSEWDYYRPHLVLHETLHALGLKHPFSGAGTLAVNDDVIANTVMSYSAIAGSQNGALSRYPSQPMPLDIAALQVLYGAAAHNSGDTVYDLSDAAWHAGFQALWDSGGQDRLDASGLGWGVRLDLQEEARSDIGNVVFAHALFRGATGELVGRSLSYADTLAIAPGAVIEDARGSAFNDHLAGNAGANRLEGGDGDDVLWGRGGNDRLEGGLGLDTALYGGPRADYQVFRGVLDTAVAARSGDEGTDSLASVERLAFADGNLAFDLDGAAGTAARVAGAVWGAGSLRDGARMGALLAQADAGLDGVALAQWALSRNSATLSDEAFVALVFGHVTGRAAEAPELAYYVGLLAGGDSQAELAAMAAASGCTATRIDLAGLAQSGLAYLPEAG